jgi:hypothetical protein
MKGGGSGGTFHVAKLHEAKYRCLGLIAAVAATREMS